MNVKTFIERPVLSIVISVAILLLGLIALMGLPIEQFPNIAPPTVEVTTSYPGADAGFSSLVNFHFPKHGDLDGIVYTWQAYADSLHAHPGWHPFSYLNNSYHRDADMSNMVNCATSLLLAPGIAQIFYGDETGRKQNDARFNVDSNQAFRSDMNWNDADTTLLSHFRKLGKIRRYNQVIATGKQKTLDTHTCLRYDDETGIIIRLMPADGNPIKVYGVFADGSRVTELYTGQTAVVAGGSVSFSGFKNNIALIKKTE